MLLGTLGAILLGDLLTGKGIYRVEKGKAAKAGKGIYRVGKGKVAKATSQGQGIYRAGKAKGINRTGYDNKMDF